MSSPTRDELAQHQFPDHADNPTDDVHGIAMTRPIDDEPLTPTAPPSPSSHMGVLRDGIAAVSLAAPPMNVQRGRQSDMTNTVSYLSNTRSESVRSPGYNFGIRDSGYAKVSQLDSEHSHASPWSLGLTTPASIVCLFLLATLIAIAHYLYCRHLDGRFVESTIPQVWNAALSIAFARAFSTALAASMSTAFTQLLWWYLRRKALSLSKIDALFSIGTSPLRLYELNLVTTTPLLWFFGLLLPLISIVTIFPPGSLVVQQLPDKQQLNTTVPTLNVDDHGNKYAGTFFSNAMFVTDAFDSYLGPSIQYLGIAKRTLMNGAYLARASPCGMNCSYDLIVTAPALRCEDISPSPIDMRIRRNLFFNYQARTNKTTERFDISYQTRHLSNEEWWSSNSTGVIRNITCATQDTTYMAHISYVDAMQNVALEVIKEKPFNEPVKLRGSPFSDVVASTPPETSTEDGPELYQLYHDAQIAAIRDTLTQPLTGYVAGVSRSSDSPDVIQSYNTSARLILLETPLAVLARDSELYSHDDIHFLLSPSIVERLMQNITISLLNTANSNTTAMVTTTVYKSAYVFERHARLIATYFGILGVCLAFVSLRLMALWQNSTAAFTGGFLQIMCTTTYSESVMNQIAREASTRGSVGLPKDLLDLKVRYGSVPKSEGAQRYTAFGTVEETEELLKNR